MMNTLGAFRGERYTKLDMYEVQDLDYHSSRSFLYDDHPLYRTEKSFNTQLHQCPLYLHIE